MTDRPDPNATQIATAATSGPVPSACPPANFRDVAGGVVAVPTAGCPARCSAGRRPPDATAADGVAEPAPPPRRPPAPAARVPAATLVRPVEVLAPPPASPRSSAPSSVSRWLRRRGGLAALAAIAAMAVGNGADAVVLVRALVSRAR